MDKYFICLANSYKYGGRCLAGIEIAFDAQRKPIIVHHPDGRPRWIRPVSNTADGAIPTEVANGMELFSLVKISDVVPCPNNPPHNEDVKYSKLQYQNGFFIKNDELLCLCIDNKHQNVFYSSGKAVPATMIEVLDYSLMSIRLDKAQAYIDEEREKSKYRMKFSYYGTNYDFPITDPFFLDEFKKDPESFSDLQNVYLTLSLGMEFEGFHFKLVAAVLNYSVSTTTDNPRFVDSQQDNVMSYMEEQKRLYSNAYAKWTQEDDEMLIKLHSKGLSMSELMEEFGRNEGAIRSRLKKLVSEQEESNWFDKYDEELSRLIDLKSGIENKIAALRQELMQQMKVRGETTVCSKRFTINYFPPKTILKFDSDLFRLENEELYTNYCKPYQKKASIVVRKNKD